MTNWLKLLNHQLRDNLDHFYIMKTYTKWLLVPKYAFHITFVSNLPIASISTQNTQCVNTVLMPNHIQNSWKIMVNVCNKLTTHWKKCVAFNSSNGILQHHSLNGKKTCQAQSSSYFNLPSPPLLYFSNSLSCHPFFD